MWIIKSEFQSICVALMVSDEVIILEGEKA